MIRELRTLSKLVSPILIYLFGAFRKIKNSREHVNLLNLANFPRRSDEQAD
jgi:hypothetical protein